MSDSAQRDSTTDQRREYHRLYYHRMKPEQRARKIAREKQWAKENPDKVLESAARFRAKVTAIVSAAKNVLCVDCGVSYPPCVMDFHHEGDDKDFTIGKSKSISIKRLRAEIAKCIVVCANCHRLRHVGLAPQRQHG